VYEIIIIIIIIIITYTIGKALSIFLEIVHFIRFLRNLFGLLEHYRQNLIKVI